MKTLIGMLGKQFSTLMNANGSEHGEQLSGHYENICTIQLLIKETIKIKKNGSQHQLNKSCC